MSDVSIHAVTGAFGYSGKYIAERLLRAGQQVITLTNSPDRPNPFAGTIKALPFHFDHPEELAKSLEGVSVLYNTYWVRFNHPLFRHSDAIRNSLTLFDAARRAAVQRIVHVSITNPSLDSPLEYFRGKAILEKALIESGLSYAILRPAVLFGREDILINNIAWLLRRLPVFGVFGDGRYRLQPIYVDDLARLAVEQGQQADNAIMNAIGPETFTYRDLVATIGQLIGKSRPIISVPPWLGHAVGTIIGGLTQDVLITKDEIAGLMDDLLYVNAPATGDTPLTSWICANAESLGQGYASELMRRKHRVASYSAH